MYYKNIKNGNIYKILSHAIDCTNNRDGTKVIVYCPLNNELLICVREETEFYIKFEKV
jgi:hypothetical protein